MEYKDPHQADSIKGSLRDFITERFLPFSSLDSFEETDSFMEKGIIDSTGVLELLEYIEEKFGIQIEDEEIIPDNLDSLQKVVNYILRKLGYAG